MLLKQSTARNLAVFVTSAADHVSGKTGLSAGLTIYACKDNGTPAAITPTVTEISAANMPGWYSLALTTAHTDTLGDLALHITATGADPTDLVRQVVSALPGEPVTLTSAYDHAKGTVAMTEAYAADGAAPTPQQAFFMIWALLAERSISGTTLTAKKLDGVTSAMTFTLDSATTPTSQTRAT